MSKVVPLAGLSAVSMVNGSDIGDFGAHRIFAVVLTIFACFVPSVYHHPDRIISSNFKNIGNESYRVSLVLSITMCCPMILDMICRISVEKKLLLDFKSLLLPFGIFAPNVFILAFCMDPGNPALFYSLILFQVVVLQSVLLAVLMVQDSQLFTNTVVNFIFYSRLCSVWCMVIYIVVDNEILAAAYFAFMCLATIIFFRKLFLWVRKNAENLYNLLFHDKIEMYDKTESQICDLHNATIMAFLEVSNLGFFANPYNRTLNYSLMCYFQIVVVVLLTLLPGRMSRRHATMSLEALDAKRNFVQYVSHEARGPLQIASLGLELLLNDLNDIVDSPPESTGAIADKKWMQDRVLHTKEILHACSLATSTLNDMLTFDKIENGMLQMEAEVVPAISFFHNEFRAFAIHVGFVCCLFKLYSCCQIVLSCI